MEGQEERMTGEVTNQGSRSKKPSLGRMLIHHSFQPIIPYQSIFLVKDLACLRGGDSRELDPVD